MLELLERARSGKRIAVGFAVGLGLLTSPALSNVPALLSAQPAIEDVNQTSAYAAYTAIEAQFKEAHSIIKPRWEYRFDLLERTPFPQVFPLVLPDLPQGIGLPTTLPEKWVAAQQKLNADLRAVEWCEKKPRECYSEASRAFLRIASEARVKSGLARVGTVNRAVNLTVRPATDLSQYGVDDYWASPLETLAHAAGDCEDYAITKYGILLYIGVSEAAVRLVLVRDTRLEQDHAVLFVNVDGHWRILDNRTFLMLDPKDASDYEPLVVLGASTIKLAQGQTLASLQQASSR